MSVRTLNDIFKLTTTISRPAVLRYKRDERWIDMSVPEFSDSVRHFSTGLRSLGVKPGDRIAILSENRPEWAIADYATLAAGAVSVPIYPTLLGYQIEYILNDCGAVAVVVSNREQLEKVLEIRRHCPALHSIIVCDSTERPWEAVRSFDSIKRLGEELEAKEGPERFHSLLDSSRPDDVATLVYTSGTTGNPKGAMLTHGNITSNVVTVSALLPFHAGDVALCILPLSHILERMADFSYLYKGGTIAYAESVTKVADNLQEVRPDVFVGVPRLYEKMYATIQLNVSMMPPARQKLFRWAERHGRDRLPFMVEHRPIPVTLKLQSAVADRLIFSKIKERLGGRVRFIISGGAPLSADLAAFFIGAGIEIYEGYGLTETSPVISANTPDARRLGTVGRPIPGVEVRIAKDGEILTRGPHVMKGYYNNPDATAQAIDAEGWFQTGDIGEIDRDGFLKITDRKKDLIINAYGKNVAPQPLENLLKSSPYIGTPVLIGDRRKYMAALIIPNFEKLERDAHEMGVPFHSREELVRHPDVVALMQKEIDGFNAMLDRQEQIRRFTILPGDFSVDTGEITPTLKVKRKVVDQKYKDLIDRMYVDEGSSDQS